MGRGKVTRERGVSKGQPVLTSSIGSGSYSKSGDTCLFTFNYSLKTNRSEGVTVGSQVSLVPNSTNTAALDIYVGTRVLGTYKGSDLKKLLACIEKNYLYGGSVTSSKYDNGVYTLRLQISGAVGQ